MSGAFPAVCIETDFDARQQFGFAWTAAERYLRGEEILFMACGSAEKFWMVCMKDYIAGGQIIVESGFAFFTLK